MVGSYCGSKLRRAWEIRPSTATLWGGRLPSWAAARQQQVFAVHRYVMHNPVITMAERIFYFNSARNLNTVILHGAHSTWII
jgi:hypothetical protein